MSDGPWPGEVFGFRSNGLIATGLQFGDMPDEQKIKEGDTVSLGGALYSVIAVDPKPSDVFGKDLIEVRAERIA